MVFVVDPKEKVLSNQGTLSALRVAIVTFAVIPRTPMACQHRWLSFSVPSPPPPDPACHSSFGGPIHNPSFCFPRSLKPSHGFLLSILLICHVDTSCVGLP